MASPSGRTRATEYKIIGCEFGHIIRERSFPNRTKAKKALMREARKAIDEEYGDIKFPRAVWMWIVEGRKGFESYFLYFIEDIVYMSRTGHCVGKAYPAYGYYGE